MIRIKGDVKRSNKVVLKDVDLNISSNKITAVIGRNGSGKSSLLYALLGCVQMDFYEVDGFKRFGYVGNELPFNLSLMGIDVIDLMKTLECSFDEDVFRYFLKSFNINVSHRLGAYSKGEAKYFMLALALARDVDVLILDEINVNIDQLKKESFKEYLRYFSDKTVVLATNQLDVFADIVDDVIYLKNENVFYAGSLYDLQCNFMVVSDAKEYMYKEDNAFGSMYLVKQKHEGDGDLIQLLQFMERSDYEKICI